MKKKNLSGLLLLLSLAFALSRASACRTPELQIPSSKETPLAAALGATTGNRTVLNFVEAKRIAARLHEKRGLTLYCRCAWSQKTIDLASCGYEPAKNPKKARQLQWEHVVPAEAFGQSFREWRDGAPECVDRKGRKYRGRKCAGKNPTFAMMEADLYNLFPENGELNGARSNYSMAEVGALGRFGGLTYGGCQAKIFERKFEPMVFAKGTVARVYLYMDQAYPGRGIISGKNEKLFAAWDKMYPVEKWECDLYRAIRREQGNENPILATRCAGL